MKTIKIVLISTLFVIGAFTNFNVYAQDMGIGSNTLANHKPDADVIEYFYDIQTGDIYDKNNKIIGKVIFQTEDSIKEGEQFMFKTVNGGVIVGGSACVIDTCNFTLPKDFKPLRVEFDEFHGKKVKY